MSRSEGGPANGRSSPTSNVSQELLPGLPDLLTLKHISTRIPWHSVQALSRVSRGWRHEVLTREVHRARVCAHATEEFAVLYYKLGFRNSFFLYSMRDNRCLELPPPPQMGRCVALDGKLYVIGGPDRCPPSETNDMYVLDLAGQRKWERCSRMNEKRSFFGCGALHGKVYVFGGTNGLACVPGSEVYDPEKDIWSPMISFRSRHLVETVGEEFFVHGQVFSRDQFRTHISRRSENTDFYDVFNPSMDEWIEWRVEEPDLDRVLFMAREKFYALSRFGMNIHVLDAEGNSTAQLQSDYKPVFGHYYLAEEPCAVLAVENELLVILWVPKICRFQLVRSRGFSDGSGRVVWEKVLFSVRPPSSPSPDYCPPSPDYPWMPQCRVFCTVRL